jgi:UDP-2-acetamido-3-amino-2,3-dideoxy-glucuronate N-acetyltransferase
MKKTLGLFGIGRWGKNIARNFFELGALHSIYDPNLENLQKHTQNFEEVILCSNEDEIFYNPNIDKVAIVTKTHDHARLIIKALEANKDVFVEKPMCFDLREAEIIKNLAKKKNKIVMVGHILHYHPVVIKMKQLLQKGRIGKILSICATRTGLGYMKSEINSLWSLGIHDISLILSILDEQPENVFAVASNILNEQKKDIFNCFLNFSSGIKTHIIVNWLNPYKEQKFIIIGTEGLLLFDDTAKWDEKLKLYSKTIDWDKDDITIIQNVNLKFIKIDYEEPLKNECRHFLKACDSRIEPYTNVDESIQVIKIIKTLLNSEKNENFLHLIKDHYVSSTSQINSYVEIGY